MATQYENQPVQGTGAMDVGERIDELRAELTRLTTQVQDYMQTTVPRSSFVTTRCLPWALPSQSDSSSRFWPAAASTSAGTPAGTPAEGRRGSRGVTSIASPRGCRTR